MTGIGPDDEIILVYLQPVRPDACCFFLLSGFASYCRQVIMLFKGLA
jgi:hypothetical protein